MYLMFLFYNIFMFLFEYLALVSVSEEVRSRCHLKHRTSQYMMKESPSSDSLNTDMAAGDYSLHSHLLQTLKWQIFFSVLNINNLLWSQCGFLKQKKGKIFCDQVLDVTCCWLTGAFSSSSSSTTGPMIPVPPLQSQVMVTPDIQTPSSMTPPPVATPMTRRQKSWEVLDLGPTNAARLQKGAPHTNQPQVGNLDLLQF